MSCNPLERLERLSPFVFLSFCSSTSHTFQNLKVSSPAALAIVFPSGLKERCSTRSVWPLSSANLRIVGYFQTTIWFCNYEVQVYIGYLRESVWTHQLFVMFGPLDCAYLWLCVNAIDATARACIPEAESSICSSSSACLFQVSMHWVLSFTRRFDCHGHQAKAFTAAVWCEKLNFGVSRPSSHIFRMLSFPPDASERPSGDHLSPQTS